MGGLGLGLGSRFQGRVGKPGKNPARSRYLVLVLFIEISTDNVKICENMIRHDLRAQSSFDKEELIPSITENRD